MELAETPTRLKRLDDDRRHLLLVGLEDPRHVRRVSGLRRVGAEEQRAVGGVEGVDAADRNGTHRVPVVGVAEVDEGGAAHVLPAPLLAPTFPPLLPWPVPTRQTPLGSQTTSPLPSAAVAGGANSEITAVASSARLDRNFSMSSSGRA